LIINTKLKIPIALDALMSLKNAKKAFKTLYAAYLTHYHEHNGLKFDIGCKSIFMLTGKPISLMH